MLRQPSMKKRQKQVLIALGWYDYRLHRGIERYAQEHGWHLSANMSRERVIPWGWEGDGILAWLGAGDDLAEFVEQAHKPTVDFSFRRPHLKFARVLEDHTHAAQLVAEHFLSHGFTHFAFYGSEDNWSYQERGQGFINHLKKAGYACEWLHWNKSLDFRTGKQEWKRRQDWLVAQMKKLPKPLAVFAANDQQAQEVLESCESGGIAVPEEVAIIGAENYLMAPDSMHTPISSVDTNLELLGYRGAALLDQMMKGKTPPRQPIRVPAAGVVARKSSDMLAVTHPGVAKGLRYIWEHSHEPINVKDLVTISAMSRRGLHKAFLAHVGRPPGQELHRVRIERAKQLLAKSDHKIETVANMCGYQSANTFCVAFKNSAAVSPKQYRDALRT